MIASLAQLSRYGEEIDDVGDEGVTAEDVEEGGDAKAFSPDVFHCGCWSVGVSAGCVGEMGWGKKEGERTFERESEEVVVVD